MPKPKRRGRPRKTQLDKNDASVKVVGQRSEDRGEAKLVSRTSWKRLTHDAPDRDSDMDEKHGTHNGRFSEEEVDTGDVAATKEGEDEGQTPRKGIGKRGRQRVSKTERDERRTAQDGFEVEWKRVEGMHGAIRGDKISADDRAEIVMESVTEELRHGSQGIFEPEFKRKMEKNYGGEPKNEHRDSQDYTGSGTGVGNEDSVEIVGRVKTKRTQRQRNNQKGLALPRGERPDESTNFERRGDTSYRGAAGDGRSVSGEVVSSDTAGKQMKKGPKRRPIQKKQETGKGGAADDSEKAKNEGRVAWAYVPSEKDASVVEMKEDTGEAQAELRPRGRLEGVKRNLSDKASTGEGAGSSEDGRGGRNISMRNESTAFAEVADVRTVSLKEESLRRGSRTRTEQRFMENDISNNAETGEDRTRKMLNDTVSTHKSAAAEAVEGQGQLPAKRRSRQNTRSKKLKQVEENDVASDVEAVGSATKVSEGVVSRRRMRPRNRDTIFRADHMVTSGDETENSERVLSTQKHGRTKKLTQSSTAAETPSKTHNKKDSKLLGVPKSRRSGKAPGTQTTKEQKTKVVHALDLEGNLPADVSLVPMSSPVEDGKETRKAKEVKKGVGMRERASIVADIMIDKDDRLLVDPGEIDILEGNRLSNESLLVTDSNENSDGSAVTGQSNETPERKDRKLQDVSKSGEQGSVNSATNAAGTLPETKVQSTEAERKRKTAASFRRAEALVETETKYGTGRYGLCFSCGESIVIPGVAQFFCKNCGWMSRAVEIKTVAPGHHD